MSAFGFSEKEFTEIDSRILDVAESIPQNIQMNWFERLYKFPDAWKRTQRKEPCFVCGKTFPTNSMVFGVLPSHNLLFCWDCWKKWKNSEGRLRRARRLTERKQELIREGAEIQEHVRKTQPRRVEIGSVLLHPEIIDAIEKTGLTVQKIVVDTLTDRFLP